MLENNNAMKKAKMKMLEEAIFNSKQRVEEQVGEFQVYMGKIRASLGYL